MAAASNLTLLMKVFEQEKELFWRANASLPEEELQRRWSAEMGKFRPIWGTTATCDDTTPKPGHSLPPTPSATTMKQEFSANPPTRNVDRTHHPSSRSVPMNRKRTSDSRIPPSPISATGNSVPPLIMRNLSQNDDDEPFSSYTMNKARRTSQGRLSLHVPVTEYDDPRDYYAKGGHSVPSSAPRQVPQFMSLSPTQYTPFSTSPASSHSPTTTMTTASTNPTTLASSGMSRQASRMGSSVCDGLDMLRLKSQASNASSSFESRGQNSQSPVTPSQQVDDSLPFFSDAHLLDFTGGVVPEASQPLLTVPSFSTSPSQSGTIVPGSNMHRTALTNNTSLPAPQTLSRTPPISLSTRPIAAKPASSAIPLSRSVSSEHRMIRVESADGSVKDKISIPKAPYVRPQHEKIPCPHCNQRPEGYRGEHELGRHINKAHSLTRTVWVCVDASAEKKLLSKCKACLRGKRYNAYYNAAAHLRRAHFNPKPKGGKGKASEEEKTKRGGSSGGEWPPMDVCKMFMQEIREFVPQQTQPYNDEEDDEEDLATDEPGTFAVLDGFQPMSPSLAVGEYDLGTVPGSVPRLSTGNSNNTVGPANFSVSAAPIQLSNEDECLYLAPPRRALGGGDKAKMLDLSLNTNVNADLPFQMSPFLEDSNSYDPFQKARFR